MTHDLAHNVNVTCNLDFSREHPMNGAIINCWLNQGYNGRLTDLQDGEKLVNVQCHAHVHVYFESILAVLTTATYQVSVRTMM